MSFDIKQNPSIASLEVNTDELESKLTTIDLNTDTLESKVDTLSTKIDIVSTELETINNSTINNKTPNGNVAANAADSGNPVKVGGKYNATPPTLDDGDRGDLELDVKGNTKVTQATTLDKTNDSITNYPVGCNMSVVDLATDADVVVSATPAVLVGIYVNTVFSAHAVNILDGAVTKLILPASTAAGTEKDMRRAIFATSLIVNSDDAATGSLVLFWRPL